MKKKKVLITNGDSLRSLVFLKSVKNNKDIEIHVSETKNFCASFASRYCKHKLITTSPIINEEEFIKQLLEYIKLNDISILIPLSVPDVEAVLKNRKLFGDKVTIPFPSYSLFKKVNDKLNFYNILKQLKIDTPKTITTPKEEINFPAIVKLRMSAGSKGVKKVNNRQELKDTYKELEKKQPSPIIQEYIEGESFGAAAICNNSKVQSVMVYKNLRQYPVEHGTGTSRISVYEQEITKNVKKILTKLKWHGIAQFDIIKSNNQYYFLEMNPRFYTSLSITVKSGLNYPYYLCNKEAKIPKTYKEGVLTRVFFPDLIVFLKSKYPLKEFLNIKAHYDDFDLNDPLPSIPLLVKSIRGKIL